MHAYVIWLHTFTWQMYCSWVLYTMQLGGWVSPGKFVHPLYIVRTSVWLGSCKYQSGNTLDKNWINFGCFSPIQDLHEWNRIISLMKVLDWTEMSGINAFSISVFPWFDPTLFIVLSKNKGGQCSTGDQHFTTSTWQLLLWGGIPPCRHLDAVLLLSVTFRCTLMRLWLHIISYP